MAAVGPPPINQLPFGLLDALGIKSGGLYPRDFGSMLVPTFELFDWYALDKVDVIVSNNTVNATGANALTSGTVPTGQVWYVYNTTLRVVTGVGEAIAIEPGWLEPNGTIPVIIGSERTLAASVTASCFQSVPPFFAAPGSSVRAVVNSVTGTVDVALALKVARFLI